MFLQTMQYREFEYLVRKYGFRGRLRQSHIEGIDSLGKRVLKISDLKNIDSRLSLYFNSDLVMENDSGKHSESNREILKKTEDGVK